MGGLLTCRATFEEFETRHGKTYSDAAEREARVDLYRQNLRFIHSKNRQASVYFLHAFLLNKWKLLWPAVIHPIGSVSQLVKFSDY